MFGCALTDLYVRPIGDCQLNQNKHERTDVHAFGFPGRGAAPNGIRPEPSFLLFRSTCLAIIPIIIFTPVYHRIIQDRSPQLTPKEIDGGLKQGLV